MLCEALNMILQALAFKFEVPSTNHNLQSQLGPRFINKLSNI